MSQVRLQVRQQLLSALNSSDKSDEELDKEVSAQLDEALQQSTAYQDALTRLKECEDISSRYEVRADNIRTISLKLDDGYERAMALFLEDMGFSEVSYKAVAVLTLQHADMPRLTDVDPSSITGTANSAAPAAAAAASADAAAAERAQD